MAVVCTLYLARPLGEEEKTRLPIIPRVPEGLHKFKKIFINPEHDPRLSLSSFVKISSTNLHSKTVRARELKI